MKTKSIIAVLILYVLVSCVSACNDEVFVRPLKVTPVTAVMGPDRTTLTLNASGEKWKITEVRFLSNEETVTAPVYDGKWQIENTLTDIVVDYDDAGVTVHLNEFVSNEPGTLEIRIDDEYNTEHVSIKVIPTAALDIRVTDVKYDLLQWYGYPYDDFDNSDEVARYPEGLLQAKTYTFDEVKNLPVLYYFRTFGEPDFFHKLVLGCGAEIAVPTYDLRGGGWSMKGEKARLVDQRSYYDTNNVPRTPAPVELPAGQPLSVLLTTHYKCLGVECVINVVNRATGKEDTLSCQLVLWLPVSLTSEVKPL